MPDPDAAIQELITSPPALHWRDGKPQAWELEPEVLRWLADRVPQGGETLETGCGSSTVLMSLRSARHTVISPDSGEQERVREWCADRGFATDHVRFMVGFSQAVIPRLETGPLDLALIDGAHAFPIPYIDWYYMAMRLNVGGYIVIDDMHLSTCRLLRDFLRTEEQRWRLAAQVGRAVMFEKLAEEVVPPDDWLGQAWTTELPFEHPGAVQRIRARIALRTRLRRAGVLSGPD